MRALALALLALLLVPVAAAAASAPVRVLWNSRPDRLRAGGAWDARVSVLQGPGGYWSATRPAIVVTDLSGGGERRVPMRVDVPPNTFRATVRFPRAGFYEVAVTRFDARDPARASGVGGPVRVAARPPAAPAAGGGSSWPWALVVGVAVAALALRSRRRRRGTVRVRD
jgi:hypothetical protein